MQRSLIYSLGTDLRSREDFMEILLAYEVKAFIDVRSFPRSKIPLFNRNNLAGLLLSHDIEYHFLGRELGGFRKGSYQAYSRSEEFLEGVGIIEAIAREKIAAIVCSERFPWKCHRRWISRELQKRGWIVEHIIDKGKVWVPQ